MAEVILFDSVLIEDDRLLVEDWLQAKYDLDGTGGTYHQYSLVSGEGDNDNDSFTLFGNQLLTRDGLDFESGESLSVRVRAEVTWGACSLSKPSPSR